MIWLAGGVISPRVARAATRGRFDPPGARAGTPLTSSDSLRLGVLSHPCLDARGLGPRNARRPRPRGCGSAAVNAAGGGAYFVSGPASEPIENTCSEPALVEDGRVTLATVLPAVIGTLADSR